VAIDGMSRSMTGKQKYDGYNKCIIEWVSK
jgi:hypothetical protein